jgi:hypothetical protein
MMGGWPYISRQSLLPDDPLLILGTLGRGAVFVWCRVGRVFGDVQGDRSAG